MAVWLEIRSVTASNNAEKDKGEMQKELPHHCVIGHRSGGDFNEGFEEIDRRDPDEGGGQLDLQHSGIDVGEPLRLIRMPFEIQPGNESLVASDDDHD